MDPTLEMARIRQALADIDRRRQTVTDDLVALDTLRDELFPLWQAVPCLRASFLQDLEDLGDAVDSLHKAISVQRVEAAQRLGHSFGLPPKAARGCR